MLRGPGWRPKGERASQGDGGPKQERWEAQGDGGHKGEVSSSKKGKLLEREECVCEWRSREGGFNNEFTMYCSLRF